MPNPRMWVAPEANDLRISFDSPLKILQMCDGNLPFGELWTKLYENRLGATLYECM